MTGFWDTTMAYFNSDRAVFDFANFLLCYGVCLIWIALDQAFPPRS